MEVPYRRLLKHGVPLREYCLVGLGQGLSRSSVRSGQTGSFEARIQKGDSVCTEEHEDVIDGVYCVFKKKSI